MWVLPDTPGIDPSYEQLDVSDALADGGLVTVASGNGHDGAITIHQRDATLFVARLAPGQAVTVPDAPHVHVFVPVGGVTLEGAGALSTGDAARLRDAGTPELVAGDDASEILVWATA